MELTQGESSAILQLMFDTLDTTAHMFASTSSIRNSSTYRVAAVLADPVDEKSLQKALDKTVLRYPMMTKRLKRGLFWYYLENNDKPLLVQQENEYPAHLMQWEKNNNYLIKVLYFNHRISVEAYHVITDGTGLSEFLKTLLFHYFKELGEEGGPENKILLPESSDNEEEEDAFRKYFLEKKGKDRMAEDKAYLIKGRHFSDFGNNVTVFKLRVSELKKEASRIGITITALLSSYVACAIDENEKRPSRRKKPIVIQVPVNLRKFFPSKTLRNFFGVVNISIPFDSFEDFDKGAGMVNAKLKSHLTKVHLEKVQKSNVAISTNIFSRITPLKLKDIFIPIGFKSIGENRKTIALSNIGMVDIPLWMQKNILCFEEVLYPTLKSPINIGVISMGDVLTVSFARNIEDARLIRSFCKQLAKIADVSVYSNIWGDEK